MNNLNNITETILNEFQKNKGNSSLYCFTLNIIPEIISKILINFHKKDTKRTILIVVDNYDNRIKLLEYFKANIENYEEYNINILTAKFINIKYKYIYDLVITVGINDDLNLLLHLANLNKFILAILTKNIMNTEFINTLRKVLPNINLNVNNNEIKEAHTNIPVKEYRLSAILNDDDKQLYDKCAEFINTSIKIFGDVDIIEKCKHGDKILNISSAEFRQNLAISNGWNENLDVNVEFQKQIDDIYNPNVLFERAKTFYTITKQRRDLLTDNNAKLEVILNICRENSDKKILIVSKRGEFAKKITDYLNKYLDNKCGDYHDCIDDCVAVNEFNEPILIKSGVNKGKPKILGAQAISSANEYLFNNNKLRILSLKNSSNKKVKVNCDIIIFTSPLCDEIFYFKTRFNNIVINSNPIITYKIYCQKTIEENILLKERQHKLIEIINEEENFIQYDENSGDIIL